MQILESDLNDESIRQLLKENPQFLKGIKGLLNIEKDILKMLTSHCHNRNDERFENVAKFLMKKGFYFNTKTSIGSISGSINLNSIIILTYCNFLIQLNEEGFENDLSNQDRLKVTNDDYKEYAKHLTVLFLLHFIRNFKLEIEGIFDESYRLSISQMAFNFTNSTDELKNAIEQVTKITEKRRKRENNIFQGGKRDRLGFVWTDEHKIEFYNTVSTLPKIKNKMLWDYGFERLNEDDFNYKIIDYLRTETAFKNVPEKLFRKAVSTWLKYKNSFSKPKPSEKPFAFALAHGLAILDFGEIEYSTMNKYFGIGKKLSKINSLI